MILAAIALGALIPDRWTFAVGGDAMFNGISPNLRPLEAIERLLSSADVAIVNLEIPLTDARTPTSRKTAADRAARKQYVLKGDPRHIDGLKRAGIDMVSLANNHGMDFGAAGANQQRRLLERAGIRSAGYGLNVTLAEFPARFKSATGVDIALVSFLSFMADSANDTCWPATEKSPGIAALKLGGSVGEDDTNRIAAIVKRAQSNSPFVVVAIHWGLERKTLPTPYQVALGRSFVDAGADVVLGHHPHVLQGAEVYKGKPIFYSLGNFVSSLPATSAIFLLEFSGRRFSLARMAPIRMAGRISVLSGAARNSEFDRFGTLSRTLAIRYPDPNSIPLPIGL